MKIKPGLYRAIVKKFEVLSGKEFSSKVINAAAYKSVVDSLADKKLGDEELKKMMHEDIETTTSSKIVKNDLNKDTGGVIQMKNCTEADSYGPSDSPVCYISAGMIKAYVEKIFGKTVEVKERKCTAMGDDVCEFSVRVVG